MRQSQTAGVLLVMLILATGGACIIAIAANKLNYVRFFALAPAPQRQQRRQPATHTLIADHVSSAQTLNSMVRDSDTQSTVVIHTDFTMTIFLYKRKIINYLVHLGFAKT